jgi:hypothetical protein
VRVTSAVLGPSVPRSASSRALKELQVGRRSSGRRLEPVALAESLARDARSAQLFQHIAHHVQVVVKVEPGSLATKRHTERSPHPPSVLVACRGARSLRALRGSTRTPPHLEAFVQLPAPRNAVHNGPVIAVARPEGRRPELLVGVAPRHRQLPQPRWTRRDAARRSARGHHPMPSSAVSSVEAVADRQHVLRDARVVRMAPP